MTCDDDRFRHAGGPYLLGKLDDDERDAFDRHLDSCADCRADIDRLRPTVELLTSMSQDDLAAMEDAGRQPSPTPAVPSALLPNLLAQAARRDRRHRVLVGALGAAAAAAAIALAVVVASGQPDTAPVKAEAANQVTMTPHHDSPVRATATVKNVPWGTQITLRCHYESRAGQHTVGAGQTGYASAVYTLQVDGAGESAHDIGSWSITAGHDAVFTSGTALTPNQIKQIEVLGPDGAVVLTAAR